MPAFREVVFVTTRPRRLGHLRKLLRAVCVTSRVRVMDPRQWCDTPEAQPERLVFLDAASTPPREALIAARSRACGSRLVLCCRTPAPEVAQTAIECGLDGVLSANLPPDDAARALQQICRGERQFRFDAPIARRAPATHRAQPTISFSPQPIAAAAASAQRPAPQTPRRAPVVSFAADRIALTAAAPRPAPSAARAARPRFDTSTPAPRSAPQPARDSGPGFETSASAHRSAPPAARAARPRFDTSAPARRSAPPAAPAASSSFDSPVRRSAPSPIAKPGFDSTAPSPKPDFDTLWMFGASEA